MVEQRRFFLKTAGMAGAAMALPGLSQGAFSLKGPDIACQHYTWFSYLRRDGVEWQEDMGKSFDLFLKSGLKSYEPSFQSPGQPDELQKILKKNKIGARSFYVNSTLHLESDIEKSITNALAIAKNAKKYGHEIVVTNPSPIKWGNPEDKDDGQLKTQAKALDRLGSELRAIGMKLAYHNHDMEMRQSAREFHHMMMNTSPENVHLCLDAHWIYRGAGNSQVALFDIVKMYADRVVEVHIRQSSNGPWSEVFGDGDIDYERLAEELLRRDLRPHLVLEQAVEEGTPHTMAAVEAIGKSLVNAQKVFEGF